MKKAFTLMMLMTLPLAMWAERVNLTTASKVAKTVLSEDNLFLMSQQSFENLYVFNSDHGFVIVAADNRVIPVLAYSDQFQFKTEEMPENIRFWMQSWDNEIQNAVSSRMNPTEEILELWQLLENGSMPEPKNRTFVKPLVKTHWDQGAPYNNLCPGGSVTGCGATALAQVMKYWEWPKTGTGSHSYTHSVYGQLSANFGNTTYDWDNMIDMPSSSSPSAQQTAVATLMYHCGVALDMNYGSSSSAPASNAFSALYTYFDYNQSDLQSGSSNNYTTEFWISYIKTEMDDGRPVLYSGWDSNGAGHGFVCDGYDANDYLHFNWGWSGYCDGYYAFGALNPGQGGTGSGSGCYNINNYIIARIHPNTPPIAAPTNLAATTSDQNVTLSWSSVSGANHYKVYRDGFVINTNVNGTSFTDSNVCYGVHSYYIKAVNSSGICSLRSNEVSATIQFPGPVPTNLTANVQANNVHLSWTAPANENAQLKYGDGQACNYAYGNGSGPGYYWGQRFTPSQLAPYAGMAVTSVQTYLWDVTQYTLFIFKEEDGELVQLASKSFNNTTGGAWFTINLNTPVVIDYTNNLLVVLYNNTVQYVAGYMENYTGGDGNARLSSTSGLSFSPINDNISWLFRTNITDGTYTYNVYRNGNAIVSNLTQTNYTDSGLAAGTYNYTVKTNYYGGLSNPSNTASAVVSPTQNYTITVSANPTGAGTVNGGGTYPEGTSITLTAAANAGYTFVNWTKNGTQVSTNTSYTFTVTESAAYVANFSLNSYSITATANPTAGGTVTGTGTYNHGQTATLTATANEGYTFVNWTKNGTQVSANTSYSFTVTESATYVANFSLNSYSITATADPTAGGTVTGTGTYNHGQTATLTATANEGYTFVNWTKNGTQVSANTSYSFTVTESAAYVANFSLNSYSITATANPTAGGTVTGTGTYHYGETATIAIELNPYYAIESWTENGAVVSEEPSFTITVTGDHEFVANLICFEAVDEAADGVTIYPVPACDKVWVKSPEVVLSYEIYDLMGSLVFRATPCANEVEVDVKGLSSGTYLIRLVANSFVYTKKMVVAPRL